MKLTELVEILPAQEITTELIQNLQKLEPFKSLVTTTIDFNDEIIIKPEIDSKLQDIKIQLNQINLNIIELVRQVKSLIKVGDDLNLTEGKLKLENSDSYGFHMRLSRY